MHFQLLTASLFSSMRTPNELEIPGNITIGGLFPVHEHGNGSMPCGAIRKGRGIHRVMAMVYAIEKINNSSEVLPGIYLGGKILDTCSNENYALNMTMSFIEPIVSEQEIDSFHCGDNTQLPNFKRQHAPLVGVVGASYSSVTTIVAQLLRIYQIAQISPASTSADLSDKTRYDFFARTVPTDKFQGMVLADICAYFNWTYVSLVYSESDYGRSGADFFKQTAAKRNICIAVEAKVSDDPRDDAEIIKKLVKEARFDKSDKGARVVVLIASNDQIRRLLRAAQRERADGLQWIASESWETVSNDIVRDVEKYARGALVIAVKSGRVAEFEEFFRDSTRRYLNHSAWIREYWEEEFNCSFRQVSYRKVCTGTELIPDSVIQSIDDKVEFVISAVYAIAHALHDLVAVKCAFLQSASGRMQLCPQIFTSGNTALKNGTEFYQDYLMKVNFETPGTESHQFHFDENGNAPPRYVIKNLKASYENQVLNWTYQTIGEWENQQLDLSDNTAVDWPSRGDSEVVIPPVSTCAAPCEKNFYQKTAGSACCWVCMPCKPREKKVSVWKCEDCGRGNWPTPDYADCYRIAEHELEGTDWLSVYSYVPCGLSVCGILGTTAVVVIMIRYNTTPIVKASGRELSYTMLFGIYLCYLMTFVILATPSAFICALRRLGIGLSFAILYSALLVKTNRIYRIFESAKRTPIRPKYIDPKSQLIITALLVAVQLASGVVWLAIQRPGRYIDFPEPQPRAVLKCNTAGLWFLMSLVYDGILIFVCTFYAIKTRQVPENFNETKFIGFTMYTTCVIWLAFVPIYFGTGSDFKIQTTTLCISISLSATTTLFCLYLPKIYVIFSDPHRTSKGTGVPTFSRPTDVSLAPAPSVYSPLILQQDASKGSAGQTYVNCHADVTRGSNQLQMDRRKSHVSTTTDDLLETTFPGLKSTPIGHQYGDAPVGFDLDSLSSQGVD